MSAMAELAATIREEQISTLRKLATEAETSAELHREHAAAAEGIAARERHAAAEDDERARLWHEALAHAERAPHPVWLREVMDDCICDTDPENCESAGPYREHAEEGAL